MVIDDYGNNTKHYRSQDPKILKTQKEQRKKLYEKNHLKKPTDIILFTDFFSYSGTSFLIKGLQETGGTISVG